MAYLGKFHSQLGVKLFSILTVVIILSVVPLSYTALQAIRGYGNDVTLINEQQIRSQAFSYLKAVTRERAGKYQAFFDRIAASAGLLGSQASTIYSDLNTYAERPLAEYTFTVLPHNGFLSNSQSERVVAIYWGAPGLSPASRGELLALTHMNSLLLRGIIENPEALASHVITLSGIGLYCTNNQKAKKILFSLPRVSEFDLRDGEPVTIFADSQHDSRDVRWTGIYQDDVIEGFMLTASAPIVDNQGVFRGITGIDVPLNTVIDDILGLGSTQLEGKVLFSFLLDQGGKLIAFPDTYYSLFGLKVDRSQYTNSGDRLDVALAGSTERDVRELARKLVEKDDIIARLTRGEDSYYVVTSRMVEPGWTVGMVVREKDMLSSVQESRLALEKTIKDFEIWGLLLPLLTIIIAVVIVFMAVKFLIMPLRTLAAATRRVADDDFSVRCPVTTSDEIGVLAASFNSMVERLQVMQERQKRYADSLELEVENRNIELSEKKEELETIIELLKKEVERRQIIAGALRNSEQQYYDTLEASMAGIYILEDGLFTYVNSAMADMFQLTRDDLVGQSLLTVISVDDRPLVAEIMRRRLQGADIAPYTTTCVRKDGSTFYGEVWAKVGMYQNRPLMVGTITDVSNIKINEERLQKQDRELQKSLDEKEVLLKEIYHRTKNNMLVIISMLDLRVQDIEDEKVRNIFLEIENQIRAMALVHEKLYQSRNLSEIDLGSYLQEIAEALVANRVLDGRITLQMNIASMPINIDYAIPLGLVVNEIVTNAVKHAFPDNRSGTVYIDISKSEEHGILLSISDDGVGLPEEIDVRTSTSFGMQIVTSLVKIQLRGSLAVHREAGTHYRISFPEPRTTKRI